MKNLKKQPTKQLEKFSNIFMQLGLVLVLFIVYICFEHQTAQKTVAVLDSDIERTIYVETDTEVIFTKETKVVPKLETPKPIPLIIDEVNKGDNNIKEFVIDDEPTKEPTLIDINALVVEKDPDPIKETIPYILIEDAPIFKGCEGLSKKENKNCFDKKMQKFVQRNFDINLANDLGLHSGKHKIYTEFVIDKSGYIIDIKIRAPHKKLEKEANRLILNLPQFTPGKQRRKPVKVKYSLPIIFRVE